MLSKEYAIEVINYRRDKVLPKAQTQELFRSPDCSFSPKGKRPRWGVS